MSSHRQHRRNNHEHGAGPPHGRDQRWVGVAASGVGDVPPPAGQHAGHGRDELVPVVRADVLGVPGDPVGRRHRRDRRRVQPVLGGARPVLRHLRRPPPQAHGDGARRPSVSTVCFAVATAVFVAVDADLAAALRRPVVLGAGRRRRCSARSPARCAASRCRRASRCSCPTTAATGPTAWSARSPACRSPSRRCSAASSSASSGWAGRYYGALALTVGRARPPGRDPHRRAGAGSRRRRGGTPASTSAARSTPSAPCPA